MNAKKQARKVYEFLSMHPYASVLNIAEATGLSPHEVRTILKKERT